MDLERTCKNCTYYPCLRINCGEVCNQHKFEHETLIDKLLEDYIEFERYEIGGIDLEEDITSIGNVSVGFVLDLERILNYLSETCLYSAKINNIHIRYRGEVEDTVGEKRQVFEIERKVK